MITIQYEIVRQIRILQVSYDSLMKADIMSYAGRHVFHHNKEFKDMLEIWNRVHK